MTGSPPLVVAVTGAGGFIGRHVCARLHRAGHAVIGLVRTSTHQAVLTRLGVRSLVADMADAAALDMAFKGAAAVVHLAGEASVNSSSDAVLRANVLGTQAVLEGARRSRVRRIVLMSTAHVYGPPVFLPMREDHPLRPESVYAASKLCAETLVRVAETSGGPEAVVLRGVNVYGPGQTADTVIAALVRAAGTGAPLGVRDPWPERDFIHVDDVATAVLLAITVPQAAGQTFNVSTGTAVSIGTVLSLVAELAGRPIPNHEERPASHSPDCRYCDFHHAERVLGLPSPVDLRTGLKRMLAGQDAQDLAAGIGR